MTNINNPTLTILNLKKEAFCTWPADPTLVGASLRRWLRAIFGTQKIVMEGLSLKDATGAIVSVDRKVSADLTIVMDVTGLTAPTTATSDASAEATPTTATTATTETSATPSAEATATTDAPPAEFKVKVTGTSLTRSSQNREFPVKSGTLLSALWAQLKEQLNLNAISSHRVTIDGKAVTGATVITGNVTLSIATKERGG